MTRRAHGRTSISSCARAARLLAQRHAPATTDASYFTATSSRASNAAGTATSTTAARDSIACAWRTVKIGAFLHADVRTTCARLTSCQRAHLPNSNAGRSKTDSELAYACRQLGSHAPKVTAPRTRSATSMTLSVHPGRRPRRVAPKRCAPTPFTATTNSMSRHASPRSTSATRAHWAGVLPATFAKWMRRNRSVPNSGRTDRSVPILSRAHLGDARMGVALPARRQSAPSLSGCRLFPQRALSRRVAI